MFNLIRLAVIISLALGLGGCGWLWPRDNAHDPGRCASTCPAGKVCVEGVCLAPDGGQDAGFDGGDGAAADQSPADGAPDGVGPDGPAVDLGADQGSPDGGTPPCKSGWTTVGAGLTTQGLNAVWGASPSEVFVVGDKGTALRFDGSAWKAMKVPVSVDLHGLHGASASNVVAVGAGGTVLQYDGSRWNDISDPSQTKALYGVWVGSGVIYAVGQGTVAHRSGTTWTKDSAPVNTTFRGVWGVTKTDIYVVGGSYVLRKLGSQWSQLAGGLGSYNFAAVWGNSRRVTAVGTYNSMMTPNSALIWSYENGQGSTVTDATKAGSKPLRGLSGSLGGAQNRVPSDVFAVGEGGLVRYFDGSAWNTLSPAGVTAQLNGVWRSEDNQLFAVGELGTMLHYRGPWRPLTKKTVKSLSAVAGSGPSDVLLAGESGTVVRYDGSAWKAELVGNDSFNDAWVAPAGTPYLLSNTGSTPSSRLRSHDGSAWSTLKNFNQFCFGLWGTAAGDLVLACYKVIERRAGGVWQSPQTVANVLTAAWGSSASDIYAVGQSGAIQHFNGSTWSADDSLSKGVATGDFAAVWGSSASDVYLVGKKGALYRGKFKAWTKVSSGATTDLADVWGSGPSDVFVVGDRGTVRRYDGKKWGPAPSGTTQPLRAIWGSGASDVYIVGREGTLLRWCAP